MKPRNHWEELLQLAKDDYRSALVLYNTKPRITAHVGFHLQQAVEKSLKAYMDFHRIPYTWSHDIDYLFEELRDEDEFNAFRQLSDLNYFAVRFRYEATAEADHDWDTLFSQTYALISFVEQRIV